jgi:hypothetical protein
VRDERHELVFELVGLDELVVLHREKHLRLLGIRPRGSLALTQPFECSEDSDQSHEDENRDRGRCNNDCRNVERRVTEVLHEQHERCAQERCGEQRDSDRMHAQIRPASPGL